jgi:hypothetical protein
LEIPKAFRAASDKKPRFLQSLGTKEQRVAEKCLPIIITLWKDQLDQARGNNDPAAGVIWELMEWRKTIATTTDEDTNEALESATSDWVDALEAK